MFAVPEKNRVTSGMFGTSKTNGNNGIFIVTHGKVKLTCIASDGLEWEHVSVSLHNRTPTWDEMCFIKSMFWDDEDCVMQLHPPKSQYVNNHPHCLHLWRPTAQEIPLPLKEMV